MSKQQQEKEVREQARLLQAWRVWHSDARKTILVGPHRDMFERLLFILKDLKLDSAPLLLGYIRNINWATIDAETRQVILHEIGTAITTLRVRNEHVPFDDPIPFPDDLPSVFSIIRELLFPA
jgi:hypothetical protein